MREQPDTDPPFSDRYLVTDGVIHMMDIDDVRSAIANHERRIALLRRQLAWLEANGGATP